MPYPIQNRTNVWKKQRHSRFQFVESVQINGQGALTVQLLESMQLEELTSSPNCIRESSRFHFKPVVVTCSQTIPPRGISPHVLPSPLRYSLQRSIQVDPGGNTRKVLFEPTRTKSLKNRFASIKELMIPKAWSKRPPRSQYTITSRLLPGTPSNGCS